MTTFLPARHIKNVAAAAARNWMKRVGKLRKIGLRATVLTLALILLASPAFAAKLLVPVGQAVGLELSGGGITVVEAEAGSPGGKAGLLPGDIISEVDGSPVAAPEDLLKALSAGDGAVALTIRRGKDTLSLSAEPAGASRRLGITVRKGMAGIGTITYYDPATGCLGALGHGVSDPTGTLLPLESGMVLQARVADVEKGKIGAPGRLRGEFAPTQVLGELTKNTPCGVFGRSKTGWPGLALPVAEPEEVQVGPATILSNVSGTEVQEYSVEILKIYPGERACGRNLLLHVTDPRLLEATGGIVQGQSGSPIVQNGRFVGAVTHVLVNDPTMGYGIFLENMLAAA